jgi:hypothetical protein
MSDEKINPLAMSDEDFIKQGIPADEVVDTAIVEEKKDEEVIVDTDNKVDDKAEDKSEEKIEDKTDEKIEDKAEDKAEDKTEDKVEEKTEEKTVETGDDKVTGSDNKDVKDEKSEEKSEDKSDDKTEEQPIDKAALFDKIMAPLKANGKTIELRTPEDAIQLMQMGANYTRKMQELAPHRRVLAMLQNNNLLDEAKLSYLIDLDKKDPNAVKKLIKDSGLDPLDVDLEKDSYVPSNHAVSDEEVNFRTVLDDLSSNPAGKETLTAINTQWDEKSKEILWAQPEVMSAIHEQRTNGVYDLIVTEMDRQKTLGIIKPDTPFLQAYTEIGKELSEKETLQTIGETDQVVEQAADKKVELTPVATRTATPKSPVTNDDKARAASPTRASPASAKEIPNVLSMSDEEFIKVNNIRV